MKKQVIVTEKAPAAVGPYSQAVKMGGFLFISGQIPLDPATGKLVTGNAETQADQIFRNISAILEAAGSSLDDIVKTTAYLVDMNDFTAVNEVYSKYLVFDAPARSAVGVNKLPKGASVEIDVVAYVG